jgi:AcrR family transcriptional regulator
VVIGLPMKAKKTPLVARASVTPRLRREERERLIVEGAVKFFAEVGFGGDTRQLAKRLGITHPLLFRYFHNKDALIERVYETVFLGSWNPYWEVQLENRAIPLRDRMLSIYKSLAASTIRYDWVRLFMYAGLKGSDINRRWFAFVREHLVMPICRELRAELNLPDPSVVPISNMEIEMVLGANARVFYLGIRKYVYAVPVRFDINILIEAEVNMFFDGVADVHSALHQDLGKRKRHVKKKKSVESKANSKEPRVVSFL